MEDLNGGQIIIYESSQNKTHVEVRMEKETIWMTQAQIALLFQTERSVITKHINNIFRIHELDKKSNVQKMHIPKSDKPTSFYNLNTIISVGYRVNSKRAT
ncbi:MAG: cell filamentation protein Fic, partial [Candidatus Roizmanbacteria bacterium]|nr:cell filamentation protein Fic [Candidatus Roizmanbacteria bacterium]